MFFESIRDEVAYQSKEIDNTCFAHFHRSAEILYVHSGEKRVIVNGEALVLHANEALFCPPYTVHVFLPSENSKQSVVTVLPEYCEQFESFCAGRTPVSYACKDDGRILQALRAFTVAENGFLRLGFANILFGIFTAQTPFERAKHEKTTDLKRIVEFLEERCSESLHLNQVANEFGYSPTYFSSFFKKNFHASLPEYINALRVRKATALLRTHQISTVYALCGFNSPQQFFLNFKKLYGCTPKEYLRNEKKW